MADVDTMLEAVTLDQPLRVARGTTIREVAGAMEDAGVSCALVGSSPSSLVTEHDLAGALAAGLGGQSTIDQVATRSPVWATSSTTVLDAVTMMLDHRVRHLLVVTEQGEPRGVLSLATATRLLLDMTVPLDGWPWN